jgi:hypothetical protein
LSTVLAVVVLTRLPRLQATLGHETGPLSPYRPARRQRSTATIATWARPYNSWVGGPWRDMYYLDIVAMEESALFSFGQQWKGCRREVDGQVWDPDNGDLRRAPLTSNSRRIDSSNRLLAHVPGTRTGLASTVQRLQGSALHDKLRSGGPISLGVVDRSLSVVFATDTCFAADELVERCRGVATRPLDV